MQTLADALDTIAALPAKKDIFKPKKALVKKQKAITKPLNKVVKKAKVTKPLKKDVKNLGFKPGHIPPIKDIFKKHEDKPTPKPKTDLVKPKYSKKSKEWWDKLSIKDQKAYLKEHPKSKFIVRKSGKKDKANESGSKSNSGKSKPAAHSKFKPVLVTPDGPIGRSPDPSTPKKVKIATKHQIKSILNAPAVNKIKGVSRAAANKAKKLAKKLYNASPSKAEVKAAARHINQFMGPKLKAGYIKAINTIKDVQSKAKDRRENRVNKENNEEKSGKYEEAVNKVSKLHALIKITALLGIGAMGVLAYHFGGTANATLLAAHLADTYHNHFGGGRGFNFKTDINSDNFAKFMQSMGSHGHRKHH
jgi:hypothetical protein